MSRLRALGAALVVAGLVGERVHAELANEIRQHNPAYEPPGAYYQLEEDEQVRILHALPGETFEFEALLLEGEQYVGPGFINSIVANGEAEVVTLTVVGHDLHPYGAQDIGEINLSAVTGTIAALEIAGDFGDTGPMLADAAGTLSVGGDVVNHIDIATESTALTIAGDLAGSLTCTTVGDVIIIGAVRADSTITLTNLGALVVGTVENPKNLEGTLHLLQGVPEPSEVMNVVLIRGELNGTIDLHGGGVADKAMLRAERGGSGHRINGGIIQGGIWLSLTGHRFRPGHGGQPRRGAARHNLGVMIEQRPGLSVDRRPEIVYSATVSGVVPCPRRARLCQD